eukprot:TRINITY_DN2499_c0_g1_i15.p1 TRINITY_DN2499_c0_g1~~TRINITY_DN2499_c0_g1_i15.p1  ORF type:complete len:122 (+),score=18.31 TRINITY_DN2499_c0_g1_i15:140-505(+)
MCIRDRPNTNPTYKPAQPQATKNDKIGFTGGIPSGGMHDASSQPIFMQADQNKFQYPVYPQYGSPFYTPLSQHTQTISQRDFSQNADLDDDKRKGPIGSGAPQKSYQSSQNMNNQPRYGKY